MTKYVIRLAEAEDIERIQQLSQELMEYEKDILELPKLVNEEYGGSRFYIIDDICATGNTLEAIKQVLEDLGGIVVGEGVVMNIVELNNNQEMFSLIDVNEERK